MLRYTLAHLCFANKGCATLFRMDELEALDEATCQYRQTEADHDAAREAAVTAVLTALRAGKRPTDVAERSPFTPAYVRRLARENGIEPAKPGPKKNG